MPMFGWGRECGSDVQSLEMQLAAEGRRAKELELELLQHRTASHSSDPAIVNVSGAQLSNLNKLVHIVNAAMIIRVRSHALEFSNS